MQKEKSFFIKNINFGNSGITPVGSMLAKFICTQYGKKEESSLFYFIIALSLLFDKGHIRVSVDEIINELEIIKLSSIEDSEKDFYSIIINEIKNPNKIIEDNPDIFLPENNSEKRAPYLLLDNGKQISTEKLYFEEKRFTEYFFNYLKSKKENKISNKNEILSAIASVEKYNNINLEEKQKEAVIKTFAEKYLIIAGGPGTGKTTVINAIIQTHLLIDPALSGMIAVAAPTGKAARRLENVLGNLVADGKVKKPQTMHSLLKLGYKERDAFLLLPYRMIIIDESSMLDLKMMQEFMALVHAGCSLVMVGDPQQLPSVGSGTLFSDITDDIENNKHVLHQNYVMLERVKRSQGVIPEFAENIRKGNFNKDNLEEDLKGNSNIKLFPPDFDTIFNYAIEKYQNLSSCAKEGNKEKMLDALSSFVLLAPFNFGLFGVVNLNQKLANHFSGERNKETARESSFAKNRSASALAHKADNAGEKKSFFHGMPIMITKNDYDNGLYNGDRGVIIYENSIYYAIFKTADGKLKQIAASILKEWEISYVQTVHKSQGNEYDSVAVVIEDDAEQIKIITREILYTAVTRAKKEVVIFSEENAIKELLKRKVTRNSGIKKAMLSM